MKVQVSRLWVKFICADIELLRGRVKQSDTTFRVTQTVMLLRFSLALSDRSGANLSTTS